ncbi:MAG: hypothetical protein MJZ22_05770, partial [Candidatus Saccharibacteria bacterium]|nr:hypothetical protein [Candidatus Saccharibacteria bacterium]
ELSGSLHKLFFGDIGVLHVFPFGRNFASKAAPVKLREKFSKTSPSVILSEAKDLVEEILFLGCCRLTPKIQIVQPGLLNVIPAKAGTLQKT